MAALKYDKYILTQTGGSIPQLEIPAITPTTLAGIKDWAGIQHRINWKYISQPVILVDEPHIHDFDEFLCFLGSDPLHPKDFGAEIELSMGQEGEKHIIDAASVICIPRGLIHCPVLFKKVGKPVLFCNVYLAPEYIRKPVK
jgi:hypothetical protein